MIEKAQAVATLSERELNILLGAIASLWGTIVILASALWRIGSRWVEAVNTKIAALEVELGKIPGLLAKAIAEHNAEDEHRHRIQMAAIQTNANVITAPVAQNALDVAVLTQRVEYLEDSGVPTKGKRK